MTDFTSLSTQKKTSAAIVSLLPMVEAYIDKLRRNYPRFPDRIYSRNSNGCAFDLHFKTKMVKVPNGDEIPDSLSVVVMLNDKMVFWMEIPGAGFLLIDGIKEDTPVHVYACEDGNWLECLEKQLPYLIREAELY